MTRYLIRLVQSLKPEAHHVSTIHYECPVCFGLNDKHHFRCQYCGCIPPEYNVNAVMWLTVKAHGAELQHQRRAHKVYFRTVPLDYYAN